MIEIIIIGAGTLAPSLKRQSAGIMVIINDNYLLLDSGCGVYNKLLSAGIDYKKVDNFYYTHYVHPDHINDLPFFLFANIYDNPRRNTAINITGPEGIKEFYNKLLELYPILKNASFDVNIREMNDDIIRNENFTIAAKPMNHRGNKSTGYRIEAGGISVVYTGDTDYCASAVELAMDADLLIIESSFPNELKVDGHLTPEYAGRIAREAGVKKLLLTHMYPVCEGYNIKKQAEDLYAGEVVIAEDFMRIKAV